MIAAGMLTIAGTGVCELHQSSVSVGDMATFGGYEQDNDPKKRQRAD